MLGPDAVGLLQDVLQYTAVGLIGGLVGTGELISRYRDDPQEAIRNRHAVMYTLINVIASLVALAALKTLGLGGDPDDTAAHRIQYTLLAGFGAMSILRCSAFTMRVGSEDIAIGPLALLQVILSATDRAVDRARATVRAEQMAKTMKDMRFEDLEKSLPQFAFAMMQNVTPEEKRALNEVVVQLRNESLDSGAKSICLGLSLSNVVGQGVVDAAVTALRHTLKEGGDPAAAAAPTQPSPLGKEDPKPPVLPPNAPN